MPDQTEIQEEEQSFTDTGTGLVGPPGTVTIDNTNEDQGPTGAVPGPPREVTVWAWPFDQDGNLMPTAKSPEADAEAKQVTANEVEDKAVRRSPRKG